VCLSSSSRSRERRPPSQSSVSSLLINPDLLICIKNVTVQRLDLDYICTIESGCFLPFRYQPWQTCDSLSSAFSSQLKSPCKLGQADMAPSNPGSPGHSSPESFEVEDDSSHQASSAQWPVQGQASPDGTSTSPSQPTRAVPPMQKRRRVTRACDECRRKKIKCDGKQPCTHCTVYSYGKFTSIYRSEADF
jgi:hypothetical protein